MSTHNKVSTLPAKIGSVSRFEKRLREATPAVWQKRGERRALELFHAMASRVPAYAHFLAKHHIHPDSVRTIGDFAQLPTLDKDNYLRAYPLHELCWDGDLTQTPSTICATSGSTGEPFYFPHGPFQDAQYALLAELYLRANFQIDRKSTLYINGFPMGAWIGGVFTYKAVTMLAEKSGYLLSIINPGINKAEIIRAVRRLGPSYDQIIIGSYGPFLKDVLDEGTREGMNWTDYDLGFIFSAEGFSEGFRDYVLKTAGEEGSLTATLNHYGTVDLGTMSYETPLSILARRTALADPELYRSLFDDSIRLPTLTQYLPELFYFEEREGALVCSAAAGLPLVRYDLKDVGGVYGFDDALAKFKDTGVDLPQLMRDAGAEETLWKLPFVYVYERNDFSVSLYAFQLYPATIRRALENTELNDAITGKFAMKVEYDENQDQRLDVHVELRPESVASPDLDARVTALLTAQLLKESSEYRETYRDKEHRITPRVIFWPYQHPDFFRPGGKQKWVVKG